MIDICCDCEDDFRLCECKCHGKPLTHSLGDFLRESYSSKAIQANLYQNDKFFEMLSQKPEKKKS